MNKVTVPKEVAAAIAHFRAQGEPNSRIYNLANSAYTETGPDAPHVTALRTVEIDTLMQALVLDHEIAKTLDEELVEFVDAHQWPNNEHTLHAIRDVLEIIARHDEKYLHLKVWAEDGFKSIFYPTLDDMAKHFTIYFHDNIAVVSTAEGSHVVSYSGHYKPLVWEDAFWTPAQLRHVWVIAQTKGLIK